MPSSESQPDPRSADAVRPESSDQLDALQAELDALLQETDAAESTEAATGYPDSPKTDPPAPAPDDIDLIDQQIDAAIAQASPSPPEETDGVSEPAAALDEPLPSAEDLDSQLDALLESVAPENTPDETAAATNDTPEAPPETNPTPAPIAPQADAVPTAGEAEAFDLDSELDALLESVATENTPDETAATPSDTPEAAPTPAPIAPEADAVPAAGEAEAFDLDSELDALLKAAEAAEAADPVELPEDDAPTTEAPTPATASVENDETREAAGADTSDPFAAANPNNDPDAVEDPNDPGIDLDSQLDALLAEAVADAPTEAVAVNDDSEEESTDEESLESLDAELELEAGDLIAGGFEDVNEVMGDGDFELDLDADFETPEEILEDGDAPDAPLGIEQGASAADVAAELDEDALAARSAAASQANDETSQGDKPPLKVRVLRIARPLGQLTERTARTGCAMINTPVRMLNEESRQTIAWATVAVLGMNVALVLWTVLF